MRWPWYSSKYDSGSADLWDIQTSLTLRLTLRFAGPPNASTGILLLSYIHQSREELAAWIAARDIDHRVTGNGPRRPLVSLLRDESGEMRRRQQALLSYDVYLLSPFVRTDRNGDD